VVATDLEIIVRQPGKPDRSLALVAGEVRVGRGEDNDLVLPDAGVSRRHCRLLVGADGVVVAEDAGSGNGTWLRGRRLEGAQRLQPGDILLIEPFSLELRGGRAPRPPAPLPADRSSLARLEVIRGPSLAQGSYNIPAGGFTIGRSEFRDLVLLDPAASRHHADVTLQGTKWRLVDRGSSNGVYLNEQRVTDAPLTHGDVIRIGNSELRFLLANASVDPHADVPTRALGPGDWSRDLSLPMPVAEQATPRAHGPRAAAPEADTPVGGQLHDPGPESGESNPPTTPVRRPMLATVLPISLGALAVALIALTGTLIVGLAVMIVVLRPASPIPKDPPPRPPAWTVNEPPIADLPVPELFDQGVEAMRRREPGAALGAFWRVLVKEPGNPAAERWSFTAGEHLVLDTLETQFDQALAARRTREAERDGWLAEYPKATARDALREKHRDDPSVLARTGWTPSANEAQMARDLDQALLAANGGAWADAHAAIQDIARRTQNPALRERSRFAASATRRELARRVAPVWRAAIEHERAGRLNEAREGYQAVLALDPRNPSATVRLAALGVAR
jgi:pSer/pThr/pTyr-binding forkhead associated (FHA) protein